MEQTLTIAIDAMGGDRGPAVVLAGLSLAHARFPAVRFLVVGDEAEIFHMLDRFPALKSVCEVRHTDEAVSSEDRPGHVLRRGRASSMALAIEAVKDGEAAVAVSAGNTGALMALSKFMLKTLPGIDRPALAGPMPTLRGESVMLDLGANVECDENNLVQFAVMGAAYARTVLGLTRPKVGLLNVGVEELKGNDSVKGAGQKLKDLPLPLEFVGFIEGDDIGPGLIDVVVTDGFTGNIALKTTEGTARLTATLLRRAFRHSLRARLGYLLARKGLQTLRDHLDPNSHNGGVFLGLAGLVVKSHGGTNAKGFASALRVAVNMARDDLCGMISEDLKNMEADRQTPNRAAVS